MNNPINLPPFEIGQKAVCVDDRSKPSVYMETVPVKNEEYHIRTIEWVGYAYLVTLEEIVNSPHQYLEGFKEAVFNVDCFAPIAYQYTDIREELAKQVVVGDTADSPVKKVNTVNN